MLRRWVSMSRSWQKHVQMAVNYELDDNMSCGRRLDFIKSVERHATGTPQKDGRKLRTQLERSQPL